MAKITVENLSGNSYKWVPAKDVPQEQNVLKIIDLTDREPNYSLIFSIKGGNVIWAPAQETPPTPTTTTPEGAPTQSVTGDAKKGGLSSTAKTAIYIAVPVVVIILAVCFGVW